MCVKYHIIRLGHSCLFIIFAEMKHVVFVIEIVCFVDLKTPRNVGNVSKVTTASRYEISESRGILGVFCCRKRVRRLMMVYVSYAIIKFY